MKEKTKNKKMTNKSGGFDTKDGLVNKIFQENLEWSRTFDALPHFVCTVDMDGKIIRANKAMIARFSAEHGDIIGKDYRLAICGTTDIEHQRANASVIGDRPSFWLETELPALDGWYRIASSPLFDDEGDQTGAICTISDITERKEAEVKLVRFRAALDSAVDNIYLIDRATMRIVDANKAGWTKLGYTKDELLDLGPQDIYYEYGFDELAELFDVFNSSSNRSGVFEATCVHKDGTGFPAEISVRTLERTQPIMIIANVRDISDRKRHEQALIKAKEKAEKASQIKSEFLSLMSHELRTPLNHIMGFGQLLQLDRNNPLTGEQKDSAQEIVNAGRNLLNLVNNILDLAALESGNIHFSIRPVPIADVLRECKDQIAEEAARRHIDIDMTNSLGTQLAIEVDPTRFKQVLFILMDNAVKFNHDNGQVAVSLSEIKRGRVKVLVKDTGRGVTAEESEKLFQPFSRLEMGFTESHGTGISLVISKNLVELMGGRIGSEPGEMGGSCFWVEFPVLNDLKEIEKNDVTLIDDGNVDGKVKPIQTVLYVEDDPVTVKLISKIFSGHEDIRLLSASEPALGLKLAANHRLDLILLDLNLPGMSGYELFKHLRGIEHLKDVPVIAVSGDAMPEEVGRGIEAGFYDYVTKPINVVSFLEKIENILSIKSKSL